MIDCRLRNLLAVLFSFSGDVVAKFSGQPPILYIGAARFLRIQRQKEREIGRVVEWKRSVLFCGNCCELLA